MQADYVNTTAARPAVTECRKSFTAEACEGLDSVAAAIDEHLEILVQRLQPLIVPRPSSNSNVVAQNPQAQAEPNALARRLQIAAGRLQTIDDRLLSVLQTLDL